MSSGHTVSSYVSSVIKGLWLFDVYFGDVNVELQSYTWIFFVRHFKGRYERHSKGIPMNESGFLGMSQRFLNTPYKNQKISS